MSNIIPFNFNNHNFRVIPDENGEPLFIAMDVAEVLEYSDTEAMTRRLDADDIQNRQIVGFNNRGVTLINESGLYAAILGSKKPEAKPFKKWVTSEVLPSIRKTGGYQVPQANQDIKPLIEANRLFKSNLMIAKTFFKGNQALLSANKATRQATNVDVLDNLGATALVSETKDTLLTASDIGKQIGLSGMKVNILLEEKGMIKSFRDHKDRKQYEITDDGEKFGEYLDTGKKHGDGTPVKQIKWYSRILDLLKSESAA